MRILKVFNNNALLVLDENSQQEKFVMGKGIGFQKKPGQEVPTSAIDKEFVLQKQDLHNSLVELYDRLPSEEIDLITAFIKSAEKALNQRYLVSLYISLADHVHFAIERTRENLAIKNPLIYQVRRFYAKEYQLAADFVQQIRQQLQVNLPEDEAAAIALHLVNARQENTIFKSGLDVTHLMDDILRIVQLHFARSRFDENSLSFQRFVTHLEYLAQRLVNNTDQQNKMGDSFLYEQVQKKYPEANKCVNKILIYLKEKHQILLDSEEIAYLILHVARLVEDKNQ